MTIVHMMRNVAWHTRLAVMSAKRYLGSIGLFLLCASIVLALILIGMVYLQSHLIQVEEAKPVLANPQVASQNLSAVSGSQELKLFQAYLLPHEDIPEVLRLLVGLAASEGLQLSKGEYKVVHDSRGGFVRYKMNLPLQGSAAKVEKFILSALAQHKTLALESVQFKRERIDAADVEARIEWVLVTKSPLKIDNVAEARQ
jgi:hypothetical protein